MSEAATPQKYPWVRQEIRNTPSTNIIGIRVWVWNHCCSSRFSTKVTTRVSTEKTASFHRNRLFFIECSNDNN